MPGRQVRQVPVGAILAGGDGRRLGGDKAVVRLYGRPLLHHAIAALQAVCDEVVVVAKVDTALPSLPGVHHVWVEPERRSHPVAGIVHALGEAAGRPVLVLGGHLPLADVTLLRELQAGAPGAHALLARCGGDHVEPLLGRYEARCLALLAPLVHQSRPDVVDALGDGVAFVERPAGDPAFTTIHAPEDLIAADAHLRRRDCVSPAPGRR